MVSAWLACPFRHREALGEIVANEPEVLLFDSIGLALGEPSLLSDLHRVACPISRQFFWDGG